MWWEGGAAVVGSQEREVRTQPCMGGGCWGPAAELLSVFVIN